MSSGKTPEHIQLFGGGLPGTANTQSNENPILAFGDYGDVEIDNLQSEQQNIDSVLNYLLKARIPKKKVGRPPGGAKGANSQNSQGANSQNSQNDVDDITMPSSVDDTLSSIININQLHAGVLLEFLKKINNFNKKLLRGFIDLTNKYHENVEKKNSPDPENPQTSNTLDSLEIVDNNYRKQTEEFQVKIDEIE